MAEASPIFLIDDVEALWPRINRCYRFDNKKKKSVPCGAFDDGAKYETSFRMNKAQAKKLWAAMLTAYKEKAATQDGWPDKFDNPFTKDEDDAFTFKASLKGAYGKDATRKPTQYDARNTVLDEDFMLTTGSTVNIAVSFTPYNGSIGTGVSLRLRAVQVIRYAIMKSRSPFGTTEGFAVTAEVENPFDANERHPTPEDTESGDEVVIDEPVKVSKKVTPAKATNKDLDSLVDAWDD